MASAAEGQEQRGARRGEARRWGGKRAGRGAGGRGMGRRARKAQSYMHMLRAQDHKMAEGHAGSRRSRARALRLETSIEISIAGEPDEHRAPRAHQAGQRRGRPHQRGGQNSKARPPTAAPTTTTRRLLTTRRQGGGREARRHQDVHVQHGLARYANSRRSLRERHSLRSWRSLRSRHSLRS